MVYNYRYIKINLVKKIKFKQIKKERNKMKKIFLMLALLGALIISGCGSDESSNVIQVGTNAEFPPFEYLEGDKVVGFDIELINEVAKIAGLEIEIKDMSFDGLLPALQTKKIDVVIAGMTATDERKMAVNFTNSYYTASQVIVVKEGNNEIKSFENLKGKKVGVMLGFTGDLVVSEMKDVENEKFNAAYGAIMSLKTDKLDAVVLDSEPAKNFVLNNEGLKIVEGDSEIEEYAIALRKDDSELLDKLNKALAEVKESGKYDELLKKYF